MNFVRLNITVEGQTEENFVKHVLSNHLSEFNISAAPRAVMTSRDKRTNYTNRGGLSKYDKVKKDIKSWIREDNNPECRFTTMFDLYALPKDFPGYDSAIKERDPYDKVRILEDKFKEDIADERFIPYIQLHEFETLIFACPKMLDIEYFDHESQIENLEKMLAENNGNPELINDNATTAPSKRILKEIPEYDKATIGPIVVENIGLPTLQNKCRHFNEWIIALEKLSE
ncbi:MAG: hypothetical protein PWQ51_1961 [Methanolobus sp.]|jgi:hypothetical protein|uniref:DUF4276 family protein n=1 Tax=unclassified Methanolobus TaxID=2629569 RepID=UPI0024AAD6D5|nr:DUF4276 family protein [Methanolobus sp.]MDI3484919.1 hypothetical protein [Methanolobus sp.]MDK2830452.1 hypothetical protein [Methanolobus sp.]MDK2939796.1 hypothetical protein [Methanolobus sp.]